MAVTSEATTIWAGNLVGGNGSVSLDSSDVASFPVTWAARTGTEMGKTTPEELLGAAHSSCFSMAFAHALAENGMTAERIQVTAAVTFVPGTGITGSHLLVSARIPGISDEDFLRLAEQAKSGCPVSQALGGIQITMEASLS